MRKRAQCSHVERAVTFRGKGHDARDYRIEDSQVSRSRCYSGKVELHRHVLRLVPEDLVKSRRRSSDRVATRRAVMKANFAELEPGFHVFRCIRQDLVVE